MIEAQANQHLLLLLFSLLNLPQSLLLLFLIVCTILFRMHSQFKQFLIILSIFPTIGIHFFAEFIKFIWIQILWLSGEELTTLFLSQFFDFRSNLTRKFS